MSIDPKIMDHLSAEFHLRKKNVSDQMLLEESEALYELLRSLGPKANSFDRKIFSRVRTEIGPQSFWALAVGVAQGTIGNWERGYTAPNLFYRMMLAEACEMLIDFYRDEIRIRKKPNQLSLFVDPIEAKQQLNHSILRAALTDFDYDAESGKIIPVPFRSDIQESIEEIEANKRDLLESLAEQACCLNDQVLNNNNATTQRLSRYFDRYHAAARKDQPNPRILGNIGDILRQSTNDEFVRAALNPIDEIAIDEFNKNHLELMRLYFRSALAKAQEVQAFDVNLGGEIPTSSVFTELADAIEAAQVEHSEVVDDGIPILLRDIANEVGELEESERFSTNPDIKSSLRRRRIQAIKHGAIYVGRFVFFTSLFISITPGAGAITVGGLATVVTIMEGLVPGSVRRVYQKMREFLPLLPELPVVYDENKGCET